MPTCADCGAEQSAEARFCKRVRRGALPRRAPAAAPSSPRRPRSARAAGRRSASDDAPRSPVADDRQERRVVTVLFADLAGSTALGERLDPEELRELQGELFELVNGEVERYGGTTEKFVGDAILAVFGIPQAHDDDPERAVRTALAVQARFGAFADKRPRRATEPTSASASASTPATSSPAARRPRAAT